MRSWKLESAKSGKGPASLPKCPTGIHGLDEITLGGLPRGRPTLLCGAAGCGKTLLGTEFLIRGAIDFDEPGMCFSFEETEDELTANVASLGFDVAALVARKKLVIDHIYLERSLIEEAGDYDLEALFVRLGHAVDSIGANRVLLDSLEALFAGLHNESVLRSELRRLLRWLKARGLTAIVTGERGEGMLTRHGLEEYIPDRGHPTRFTGQGLAGLVAKPFSPATLAAKIKSACAGSSDAAGHHVNPGPPPCLARG